MIRRLLVAGVVLLASDAAAQCVAAKRGIPSSAAERAEAAAVLGFGQRLAGTRDELLRRHGTPLSARMDTTQWFGGGVVDTAYEWRYATFAVSGYRSGEGAAEMAAALSVFGRMEESPVSVRVGLADTATVSRFLGPAPLVPTRGDTAERCYRLSRDGDADEELSLLFVRGKLVRATWGFYTG
jgi:hypothetical protein